MDISLFDYNLPETLIAQYPAEKREFSRLLVLHRDTGVVEDKHFYDIVDYIREGDVLVMNDSKVIHARLNGTKESTGAAAELFLIKKIDPEDEIWEVLAKPGKRLHTGDIVSFGNDRLKAVILSKNEDGSRNVRFETAGNPDFMKLVGELGDIPLPPYIRRKPDHNDEIRYQTVYSHDAGSVAAPTAGLHFTEDILNQIRKKGAETVFVTLHVGPGTFKPVKTDRIEDHKMHKEIYTISEKTAETVNRAKAEGRRVICVGTTSVRTLESAAVADGKIHAGDGETDIFIYTGYKFKICETLITNFHLPKSTLLMLISAFYDREKILEVYQHAVDSQYRFFSYGDAMLLI